jgi:hypothetical protein
MFLVPWLTLKPTKTFYYQFKSTAPDWKIILKRRLSLIFLLQNNNRLHQDWLPYLGNGLYEKIRNHIMHSLNPTFNGNPDCIVTSFIHETDNGVNIGYGEV